MKKLSLFTFILSSLLMLDCTIENENSVAPSSSFEIDPNDFKGTILDGTISLNPSLNYKLTGALVVKEGATLNIPAGTTITASAETTATSAFIGVERGATINISGTAANPVVMTAENTICWCMGWISNCRLWL